MNEWMNEFYIFCKQAYYTTSIFYLELTCWQWSNFTIIQNSTKVIFWYLSQNVSIYISLQAAILLNELLHQFTFNSNGIVLSHFCKIYVKALWFRKCWMHISHSVIDWWWVSQSSSSGSVSDDLIMRFFCNLLTLTQNSTKDKPHAQQGQC